MRVKNKKVGGEKEKEEEKKKNLEKQNFCAGIKKWALFMMQKKINGLQAKIT